MLCVLTLNAAVNAAPILPGRTLFWVLKSAAVMVVDVNLRWFPVMPLNLLTEELPQTPTAVSVERASGCVLIALQLAAQLVGIWHA